MAYGITYPGSASIPLPSGMTGLSALVDGFESGFGKGKGWKNDKNAEAALGRYYDTVGGQPTGSLASLGGQPASSAPAVASAAGSANPDGVFDPFIATVRQGGLTNPYGLAAVAATGKAESGFSPQNAVGQWSDPSQSGQPGTAGGIMSWRGDRLQKLRNFAAMNGDDPMAPKPETQAKFLLAEDPTLIETLNKAGSVQEAQQIMNQAWRFAGYDRSGGESSRRLQYAESYLPMFEGQGASQGVQVADASSGVPQSASMEQPAQAAPQQSGVGPLAQFAAGALGAPNVPMPSRDDFLAMMRSEQTRPLATALLQARMTGNQTVAKQALDMALKLDERQREIAQQQLENNRWDQQFSLDQQKANQLPADVQEYNVYAEQARAAGQEPMGFLEYQQALKGKGMSLSVGPDGEVTFSQGGAQQTGRDAGYMGKELSKADVALLKDSREQATVADDLDSLATQLEQVAPRVGYTGPGGDLYGAVDDAIGVLPGDKGARGAFRSLAMDSQLAMTQKTKGAITDREMGMFREAVPNLSQTPEGNKQIVNVMRGAARRVKTRAAFMEEYLAKNGSLQNAQSAWTNYMQDNPLLQMTGSGFQVLPPADFAPYLDPSAPRQERKQNSANRTTNGVQWSIEP